jgi:S-DNA-T family DNA segregation ATPase FtsK/SpoIIIE
LDLGIPGVTDAVPVGRGGYAVVYRAYQSALDRWVAVKILPLSEKQSLKRFETERRVMGRLSQHPGIVTIYDSGYTEREEPYLVMSYHERGSLRDRLRDSGPVPWLEACRLLADVSDTIDYAHGEGIVHRDLKPGNILISDRGGPLVTDFGVAQLVDRPVTSTASVPGITPAFSAPELLQGSEATQAADVYALGATLLSLLTSAPPFDGDQAEPSIATVIERIMLAPIPDLRAKGIPDSVCKAIEWSMAKAPEDRPGSADEFGTFLRSILADNPVEEAPKPRRRDLDAIAGKTQPADGTDEVEPGSVADSEAANLVSFGLELEKKDGRQAVQVSMPSEAPASQLSREIRAAAGIPGRSGRLKRVVDSVPLHGSLPLVGQVGHGQRLTFEELPTSAPSTHELELRVVGGPLSGSAFPLGDGRHVLGRDEQDDLSLPDGRISRQHAVITVAGDSVSIEDNSSSNGTFVNGERVSQSREIGGGAVVEVGSSLIQVAPRLPPPHVPDGSLWVDHNRPPRIGQSDTGNEYRLKAPPERVKTNAIQWGAVFLPIVLGLAMAIGFHTWYMLTFALLSPAIIVWNRIAEKRSMGKMFTGGTERFQTDLDDLVRLMQSENEAETRSRHLDSPDPEALLEAVRTRNERLWQRRPVDADFLSLRVGWADQTSLHRVVIEEGGDQTLRDQAEDRLRPYSRVSAVPLSVELSGSGVIGVAGAHENVDGLVRWLVAQLSTLHSPRDLAIYAIVPPEEQLSWDWLRWLPQTTGAQARVVHPLIGASTTQAVAITDALIQSIRSRQQRRRNGTGISSEPSVVALIYGSAVRDRATLSRVLTEGPEVGIHVIWAEETPSALPGECGAIVSIDDELAEATVTWTRTGATTRAGGVDGVSVDLARDFAEGLAPIRDASAASITGGIPDRVDLPKTLGMAHANADDFVHRWSESPPGLKARIGVSARGPYVLDLERDGPHGLIGGMTNSGKSELLQTLVLALTATYPPDRLNLLLIDYKGGTAFKDCVDLPHTVGLVTDLDDHLAERALTSLHAEIRRRERLLRDHGAKDLGEMSRLAPEATPPSLAIVVDEFYALATELPAFITGMVDVASRGRALGLHLILATQRPTDSVVSENIRANANLKIALRVADDQDSIGIVATQDAARIDKSLPGRAFIRTGHEELTEVQTAFAGDNTLESETSREIIVAKLGFGGEVEDNLNRGLASNVPDVARLVAGMRQAAEGLGISPPRTPWLPPLKALVPLRDLEVDAGSDVAVLGLHDLPEEQAQQPWLYDVSAHGSMVVYGSGGTGKTTTLRTLVASLARNNPPRSLHVYGLDFGSKGLAGLESLPQCGGIAFAGDNEKVLRLLSQLEKEISDRKDRFAAAGASSLSEFRSLADPSAARIVVLLDSYGGFYSAMQEVDHGAPVERLTRILAEGRSVGVDMFITASRKAEVPGSVTGLVSSTLVLRMANSDEYLGLGIQGGSIPVSAPPGRGFVDGNIETQVAVFGEDGSAAAQRMALVKLARQTKEVYPGQTAPPIRVLPNEVSIADFPIPESPLRPMIGLDDENVEPTAIDMSDNGFLVVGPPRSGRTTTLATLSESIRSADPEIEVHLLAPRRTGLTDLDIWTSVHSGLRECDDFATELEKRLEERTFESPPVLIVIDDGEELTDSASGRALETIVRRGRDVGIRVIGACEVQSAHRAFGSWVSEARKHKVGLLLTPDFDIDGDLFGVRLPRTTQRRFPPGRGFLVERGGLALLQVAR